MTMTSYYPPGWQRQYDDYVVREYKEQSPHTSDSGHVLQRGESIPVTEQEEEAWEMLAKCAGYLE